MKRIPAFLASIAVVLPLAGCDYGAFDNYDPPTSLLSGRVVYQGSPVGVRSNGVQLELWQPSYELNQKIPVHVDQDGSFSAMVFDGDYRLNLLVGNGPWLDSGDTVEIRVRGDTEVEVPVTPYYVVQEPSIQHSAGAVTATFDVAAVQPSREVEYVGLYVSTTSFVDRNNMAVRVERSRAEIDDPDAPITLSVDLTEQLASGDGVFARIGIKTVGVAEMIFSPVQQVQLP